MPIIYRVENKELKGCYSDYSEFCFDLAIKHSNETHPNPYNDKGINRVPERNEICGFISIKQFKAWFTNKERRELYKFGFRLKRIEVKEITAVGEKQILAIR